MTCKAHYRLNGYICVPEWPSFASELFPVELKDNIAIIILLLREPLSQIQI